MKNIKNYPNFINGYFNKYLLVKTDVGFTILENLGKYEGDYSKFKKLTNYYPFRSSNKILILRYQYVLKILVEQSDNLDELIEKMEIYINSNKYNL